MSVDTLYLSALLRLLCPTFIKFLINSFRVATRIIVRADCRIWITICYFSQRGNFNNILLSKQKEASQTQLWVNGLMDLVNNFLNYLGFQKTTVLKWLILSERNWKKDFRSELSLITFLDKPIIQIQNNIAIKEIESSTVCFKLFTAGFLFYKPNPSPAPIIHSVESESLLQHFWFFKAELETPTIAVETILNFDFEISTWLSIISRLCVDLTKYTKYRSNRDSGTIKKAPRSLWI